MPKRIPPLSARGAGPIAGSCRAYRHGVERLPPKRAVRIITGFEQPDGTFDFAADVPVSFEQMMTIIARTYASINDPAAEGDLSAFVDGADASEWSFRALAWAHGRGLVTGYDEPDGKYLRPGEPVKRERAAMVLMRAFQLGIME